MGSSPDYIVTAGGNKDDQKIETQESEHGFEDRRERLHGFVGQNLIGMLNRQIYRPPLFKTSRANVSDNFRR